MNRPRRRAAALVLAVVGVLGLGVASAAQLGLISSTLQAGSAPVGTCQPVGQALAVAFTSTFTGGQYVASRANVTNLAPACAGRTYRLQLVTPGGGAIDLNGTAPGSDLSGTVAFIGGALVVDLPDTPVSTIGAVAVVLHS